MIRKVLLYLGFGGLAALFFTMMVLNGILGSSTPLLDPVMFAALTIGFGLFAIIGMNLRTGRK